MNGPRKLLLAVVFTLVSATFSLATDIYIAQNVAGANTGVDCADAHSAAWFNASGNWGSGATQIGAGGTVHLCGTITSELTAHGSGSSGSPITILFETGAKISLPVCSGGQSGNGCLNVSNLTYIIVDGGSNGIIENTTNGSGLGNQAVAIGIHALSCGNCEIRNLTIRNLYQHTSSSDTTNLDGDGGIAFSGSNFKIDNNTFHDIHWTLNHQYGNDTNIEINNNDISRTDHGYAMNGYGSYTVSTVKVHDNHFHDPANWDATGCPYHHDGIHLYGDNGAKGTGVWLYNNQFDGAWGNCPSSQIFMETGTSPWTDSTGVSYVFNSVAITDVVMNNGVFNLGGGSYSLVANNTIIENPAATSGICLAWSKAWGGYTQNNLMSGCGTESSGGPGTGSPVVDYNMFGGCAGYNCYIWNQSVYTTSVATWRSACSCDAHSQYASNPAINTSTGQPQSNSPVIGAGTNLIGLGITALNTDKAGVARPSSGAWDIGAYDLATTSGTPSAPTGLSAIVQ